MQRKRRKKRGNALLTRKINSKMRMKLVWLFGIVVLAFVGLGIRITVINASQGKQYSKQVLSQSQQKYDSRVIPFKRGDITDRNGVVLATSEKVYKVILDCKVVNTKEEYVEPTIKALVDVLGWMRKRFGKNWKMRRQRAASIRSCKAMCLSTRKKRLRTIPMCPAMRQKKH